MNKDELLEEISNILSYDDKDEDEKLEKIKKLIKHESIKNEEIYVGIFDFQKQKIEIKKMSPRYCNENNINSLLGHSNYQYMELDKFPNIKYKETNLFQLLENVMCDIKAGNFDINQENVDTEFYLKLIKHGL